MDSESDITALDAQTKARRIAKHAELLSRAHGTTRHWRPLIWEALPIPFLVSTYFIAPGRWAELSLAVVVLLTVGLRISFVDQRLDAIATLLSEADKAAV